MRPSDISGLEKFEGVGKFIFCPAATMSTYGKLADDKSVADPAEFCNWGYAVANIDARGSGHSEGASGSSQRASRSQIDVPASQAT